MLLNLALSLGARARTRVGEWGALRRNRDIPWVVAHRGASADAPENSMAAFRLAGLQGADALELDIRRCRSGEIVVFHDQDLNRMAHQPLRVADCDLETLQRVNIGQGERIPTLEQVLTDPDCPARVNIEIKAETRETHGIEAALVRLLKQRSARERVVVSSFNPLVLARLAMLDPGLARGFLYHPDTTYRLLRRPFLAPIMRPHLLHPCYQLVTPSLMRWAKRLDYRVMVWTVDDPAEWDRLIALKVDGIITNRPGLLRRHLGQ